MLEKIQNELDIKQWQIMDTENMDTGKIMDVPLITNSRNITGQLREGFEPRNSTDIIIFHLFVN